MASDNEEVLVTPRRARVQATYGSARRGTGLRPSLAYLDTPEPSSDVSTPESKSLSAVKSSVGPVDAPTHPSYATPDSTDDDDDDGRCTDKRATKRRLTQAPLSFTHKPKAPRMVCSRTRPHRQVAVPSVARPKKTQAFLDFGQKPLLPEPCKECGMAYQPGREEDEQLHRVYHRAWRKRQQQTLVWDIGALSTTGTAKSVEYPSRLRAEDGGRIAAIHTVDPHTASRRQVQRALEVLNHVNEQLGACLLSLSDLSQQHQRKIFLYVSPRGRVEGCVLAEVISQARRIIPDSASVECEQEPVRAVGGISRIWVAPEARRSGVASQMVQVVCHQLAYGFHIAQDQLAFTQPTGAGRALAEQVLGRPDFLVYDEERDL